MDRIVRTEFCLDDAIKEAHELQDWAFEESRTSLEILQRLQPQESIEELLSDLAFESDSDLQGEDPAVDEADQPTEPLQGQSGDAQGLPTRQARRRRRNRQRNTPTLSRKENLTKGRVEKASRRSFWTDVEVSTLKPGLKFEDGDAKVYRLEELLARGFELLPWDGVQNVPILSKEEAVYILLAGRPKDPDYVEDMKSMEQSMHRAREQVHFNKESLKHRRGAYPMKSTGISYGGGSKVPGDLGVGSKKTEEILKSLETERGMARLVGFINRSMEVFAKPLWNFKVTVLNLLELGNPGLRRHFQNHPLASTTFNFGPRTCTIPHKDLRNLSFGWCSVTSLGNYDPTKGGHLVLWDLKLIVEFPPYSTIFLPSAIVMHSNTRIQAHETRLSITQYSSAGLFSWFAYENGPKGKAKQSGTWWWDRPRHLFSKLEDVLRQAGARLG